MIIPGESASQDVLVGVTSWGLLCATEFWPGVFARVSYAYDWIAENVCAESSNPPGYLCDTPKPTTPEVSLRFNITILLQHDVCL